MNQSVTGSPSGFAQILWTEIRWFPFQLRRRGYWLGTRRVAPEPELRVSGFSVSYALGGEVCAGTHPTVRY
jgi:hypothetical protein